jgi:two-component system sensor histidine kinase/response regulator
MNKGQTINPQRLDEIRAIQRPGGASLIERLIRLFDEESAVLLMQLEDAIERCQAEEVRAAAHKFKSVSGNVGAEALSAWCLELEQKGREGQLDGSVEILEEIRNEHARASEALSSELNRSSVD